jgi:hypothetical protein
MPLKYLRRHDIHSKFHDNRLRHSSNINVITATILEAAILLLPMRGFMKYTVETASCGMICIPNSMKFGRGVQLILRFHLRNLRGFNIGITDGTILQIMR